MGRISIRQAFWEDINNILEIKKQAHNLYVEKRPDVYRDSKILYTNNFLKSFLENNEKLILIGLMDNEVVVYSFLEFIDVHLPMMVKRKYIYIHDLAVSEKYRHQGIATCMLTYIEEYAMRNGSSKIELAVHLFSQEAIRLYERMGFSPRAIRMEKNLNFRTKDSTL
jgi:ribosomal protein S18 acetylase RimI-like enzyme